MASRGRGCKGGGWGNNQPPLAFNQFMEAISAMTTTISQESVVATTIARASGNVGQGGPSNLQMFKAHHPPTFKGGKEPMETVHWYRKYFRGYKYHLRCHDNKASYIPAKG